MNILWDFDGTLFNTYPAYTNVLAQVLDETVAKDEIYEQLKVSYSHAIRYFAISSEVEKHIKEMNKQIPLEELKPFEGVEKVLQFAEKNVIMTHKSRATLLPILAHYGWDKYFAEIVTIDDGFPRKPHSASYQYLHEKYGIDLAVGDRELDLLPAKEIGIKTCMFQGRSEIADYQLRNYEEFFSISF